MKELGELLLVALVSAPLFYLQYRVSRAAVAYEKSLCDDSKCRPGYTTYGGPM
jgi:hypothetical protein